jgi:hypothetical protein
MRQARETPGNRKPPARVTEESLVAIAAAIELDVDEPQQQLFNRPTRERFQDSTAIAARAETLGSCTVCIHGVIPWLLTAPSRAVGLPQS